MKIGNLGGIEALLKAMKDHPAHPGVQEQACGALFNLAANAENKVKISNLGPEEPVRRAMAAANKQSSAKSRQGVCHSKQSLHSRILRVVSLATPRPSHAA